VPVEEDGESEASEWGLRERREREEERSADAEELGARGGGGGTAAVPTHAFLHGVRRKGRVGDGPGGGAWYSLWALSSRLSFQPRFHCLSHTLLCHFLCNFLDTLYIFLGQAWSEGKGELATFLLMSRRPASTGPRGAGMVKQKVGRTVGSIATMIRM